MVEHGLSSPVKRPYKPALPSPPLLPNWKVGLRKKLWQKLSPLRLGYLAWSTRDLAAWLGHVGIQVQDVFFRRKGFLDITFLFSRYSEYR